MTKHQRIAWKIILISNLIIFLFMVMHLIQTAIETKTISIILSSARVLLISPSIILLTHFAYRKHNRIIALILTTGLVLNAIVGLIYGIGLSLALSETVPPYILYIFASITTTITVFFSYVFIRALIGTFRHYKTGVVNQLDPKNCAPARMPQLSLAKQEKNFL